MSFFGKKPTAKEVAKEQKRELKGVERELDRDRVNLEREEKRLVNCHSLNIRKRRSRQPLNEAMNKVLGSLPNNWFSCVGRRPRA